MQRLKNPSERLIENQIEKISREFSSKIIGKRKSCLMSKNV